MAITEAQRQQAINRFSTELEDAKENLKEGKIELAKSAAKTIKRLAQRYNITEYVKKAENLLNQINKPEAKPKTDSEAKPKTDSEAKAKTNQVTNKLAQARDAFRKENLENAKSLAEKAADISRNINNQNLLNKANSLLADIRDKKERRHKVTKYHNTIAEAKSKLNKGNFDRAKILAQRAISLAPNTTTQNKAKDLLARINREKPEPTSKPSQVEEKIKKEKPEPTSKPSQVEEKDITTDINQFFKNYWPYLAVGGVGLFLFMSLMR